MRVISCVEAAETLFGCLSSSHFSGCFLAISGSPHHTTPHHQHIWCDGVVTKSTLKLCLKNVALFTLAMRQIPLAYNKWMSFLLSYLDWTKVSIYYTIVKFNKFLICLSLLHKNFLETEQTFGNLLKIYLKTTKLTLWN